MIIKNKHYECTECENYICELKTNLPVYPDCPGGLNDKRNWIEKQDAPKNKKNSISWWRLNTRW